MTNEALFRRNAQACESAKHPTCVCHCGGAFHGAKHSEKWITDSLREIAESEKLEAAKRPGAMADFFESSL